MRGGNCWPTLDQWGAQLVVLSEYANKNLSASIIKEEEFGPHLQGDSVAAMGQMAVVANHEDGKEKINAQVFGLSWNSFFSSKTE